MKPAAKSSLIEFVVAAVTVLAVLAWIERTARTHRDRLRRELDDPALVLASVLDRSRADVLELRPAFLEGKAEPDPARLNRLQDLAKRLESWSRPDAGTGGARVEGEVTLRVSTAEQELLGHPADVVRIEVSDTGAGMPPARPPGTPQPPRCPRQRRQSQPDPL